MGNANVSISSSATLRTVARVVAGAVPAPLVLVFAGLLALLALACGPGRRDYALDYADASSTSPPCSSAGTIPARTGTTSGTQDGTN